MEVLEDKKKPYWQLIPLLILLFVIMIIMNSYMPPSELAPEGYSSTILAFEFARNRTEINEVFIPLSMDQIKGLDMVNYIDYAYMVVYSLLLGGFFFITQKLENKRYLVLGMVLAALALVGDFFENIQLLDLSKMFISNAPAYSYESVLANLFTFTWLKWGALAIALALLFPVLWKRKLYSKITGIVLLLPIIMLVVAHAVGNRVMMDRFGTSVIFGFLALAVYIIAYRDPKVS